MPTLSSDLVLVTGLATDELAPVWELDPAEIPTALIDVLPAVVDTYAIAAAAVAADAYDTQREAAEVAGLFAAIVAPLQEFGTDSLALWGTKKLVSPADVADARTLVEGGLQKRIVNAANETMTLSAAEDPRARGYMRRTRPGACDFCRMVASRGGVYTKTSARFACHDHCHCEAVPAWGGRPLPVRPYKPSDRPSTELDRARVRAWIAANL